jgi:hypothetical protein
VEALLVAVVAAACTAAAVNLGLVNLTYAFQSRRSAFAPIDGFGRGCYIQRKYVIEKVRP